MPWSSQTVTFAWVKVGSVTVTVDGPPPHMCTLGAPYGSVDHPSLSDQSPDSPPTQVTVAAALAALAALAGMRSLGRCTGPSPQ